MSDLISREEAINILEEKRVQLNGSATMDMLIEKISNIPSQKERKPLPTPPLIDK